MESEVYNIISEKLSLKNSDLHIISEKLSLKNSDWQKSK